MPHATQQAFLIRVSGETVHGLAALNEALDDGARVVHTTALGGGHATDVAALVVVEQSANAASAMPVQAEREPLPSEQNDPVSPDSPVEGDGAPPDTDPDVEPPRR